jgi:serine/alanine adding enzyme
LWKQFDAKVRNQIRKAERSGPSVEVGGEEKLREFYQVFAVNMRDLGSPVHAQGFFKALLDAFSGSARIALVYKDTTPIGGLVALAFKDTMVVPWASSLRQYFSLCPNMLLYWETIRRACMEGFKKFDFGRSSRDSNTYRFKRQWGALEEQLYWYTIPVDARRAENHGGSNHQKALFAQMWQRLPLSVTRWLGPRIRKYITL